MAYGLPVLDHGQVASGMTPRGYSVCLFVGAAHTEGHGRPHPLAYGFQRNGAETPVD